MKLGNKFGIILFMIILHSNVVLPEVRDSEPQVLNIVSLQDALINVRKVIANFPFDNPVDAPMYEKNQSHILVRCAKVLYDNARQQVLVALQEIDTRKVYWQNQQDHQWRYFLTKNPLKWITGKSQDEEIKNNLELLESHQGELHVLLGQLAEQGNAYDQGYKTSFLSDYKKGYEWIDGLLGLLSRIKVPDYNIYENASFMARVMALKLKLEGVRYFKDDILSDIKETQVPSQLAQNWLKYGTLGLVLGYGYSVDGIEKLQKSSRYIAGEVNQYVVSPVQKLMAEVFIGENIKDTYKKDKLLSKGQKPESELIEQDGEEKIITSLPTTQQDTLALAKQFVIAESKKYEIKPEDVKKGSKNIEDITHDMDSGDYSSFQKFLEEIAHKGKLEVTLKHPFKSVEKVGKFVTNRDDYVKGTKFLYELQALSATAQVEDALLKFITKQQKQFAGVSKLVLLTPALLTGALAYAGYQNLPTKNYNPIRRALLEINSLFVDQSKPLDDERYGKMLYLLYKLKRLAEKDLPQKKNIRAEFLQDLDNIESKEFDVAAKRRIIDDMFRKYSFLGLVQKK